MPRNKEQFTHTALKRIMKSAGAPRISKKATQELASHITVIASELAKKTVLNAQHVNRNTILAKDVMLASMQK